MMRPLSLRWLVLFAVVVLVAGCSSDDGASEDTAAPQSERTASTFQAELETATDALVDQWGSDRDAFFVVAWSLDAGYSAAQIIEAAAHDGTHADGTVVGPSGSVLEPEYQPAELLVPLDVEAARFGPVVAVAGVGVGSALRRLVDEAPSNAEVTGIGFLQEAFDSGLAALEEQAEADERMTLLVMSLAARGYSVRQIAEGLVLDQWGFEIDAGILCFYLTSGDSNEIARPVHPPADNVIKATCPPVPDDATTEVAGATTTTTTTEAASSTTTTTVPETLTFPRTYSGGGSSTWSLSWSNGSCRVEGNTMELVLKADGTLTGTYKRIEPTFFSDTAPGATRATVACGDQIFTQDPIEVTGSHTPPNPGTDEPGTVAVEIVGWSDWHVEGDYTATDMAFKWEIRYEATGYQGDELDPQIVTAVDYQLLIAAEG